MQSSLTASILSYLKLLDPTVNRCRMEKRPKRSKSFSAIEILLFFTTPLLITSTAVVSIAAPQIAQVNPEDSINRPILKVGSQGERVSELQAALKLLGFYSGAVDGTYSENTANAVSRFKQAAGLNPDGIVDASTWQRLFPNQPVAASTVPSSQPRFNSATNFPVPTQASNVTNVVNSNPPKKAVTQVPTSPEPRPTAPKKAVTRVATSPEPRPATPKKTTTSSTQKTPNRTTSTTRKSTTQTGQTTRTGTNTTTNRTPGIQYTSEGLPILRIGLRGSEVVKLQQQLKKLGLLKGDADGDFGETTEAAVKTAQTRYGLEADGVVGGSTWEVLLRRQPQQR
ncbi:MAG: peptidoglycan-binding protein [Nostoc sp.]|uniref:peptidoglycan-binding domain-containing protein n=1 Tax=Nostoc sp. TaxID=1180 RepID=UPI002FF86AFC